MKKFLYRHIGLTDEVRGQVPSLHDSIELALGASESLLQDVLDGLVAACAAPRPGEGYGAHAPVNRAATDYVVSQAAAAQKTFAQHLRRQVYSPVDQGSMALEAMPVRFEDLQWFDGDQVDLTIELALAQQAVGRHVDEVLPGLHALISTQLGWTTVQSTLNPLKPQAFVQALYTMLDKHAPDAPARTALMQPAAGLLGMGLSQLYRELMAWLRAHGVEPATPVAAGKALRGPAADSVLGRRLLSLDKLRQLLAGDLDDSQGTPDFLHTVPASFMAMEDLKLIEPMIKRLAQRATRASDLAVRAEQVNPPLARAHTEGRQLGRQLGAEVLSLMLDQLTQDARMLAPVRAHIKALEPTLLTLTHTDPRFFSDRQHPARQLLDRVTHQSLAFCADTDPGFAHFQQSCAHAVARLSDGPGDAAAFARVLQRMERDWSQAEATQRQQQQEAALTLLHAEQRHLLAQRWAVEFQTRLADRALPEWLSHFLCGPWAQVVAQAELACTDGRADPAGYVALVDELIWSVQPSFTRRNRARLVQLVPELLIKLRQGLQAVQYPPARLSVLLDAMVALHEQAFEGPRASAPPESVAPTDSAHALGQGSVWLDATEAQESGFFADDTPASAPVHLWTARDLQAGVWVDLRVQGVWRRARLSWVSPHRTLFMFVALGGSAHSMTRRTMERLRMQGAIRVVSHGCLVDEALDDVAQAVLKNDLAAGPKSP